MRKHRRMRRLFHAYIGARVHRGSVTIEKSRFLGINHNIGATMWRANRHTVRILIAFGTEISRARFSAHPHNESAREGEGEQCKCKTTNIHIYIYVRASRLTRLAQIRNTNRCPVPRWCRIISISMGRFLYLPPLSLSLFLRSLCIHIRAGKAKERKVSRIQCFPL